MRSRSDEFWTICAKLRRHCNAGACCSASFFLRIAHGYVISGLLDHNRFKLSLQSMHAALSAQFPDRGALTGLGISVLDDNTSQSRLARKTNCSSSPCCDWNLPSYKTPKTLWSGCAVNQSGVSNTAGEVLYQRNLKAMHAFLTRYGPIREVVSALDWQLNSGAAQMLRKLDHYRASPMFSRVHRMS
jgi:hypothetical protein